MFKLMLISIVAVPALLAIVAAKAPNASRGLVILLALTVTYNVVYMVMLYYLRVRWVGW